jgi:hypothetical protein
LSQLVRKIRDALPFGNDADAFMVSFPKCGRTWLRVMLGRALYRHAGIDDLRPDGTRLLYPEGIKDLKGLPRISFTHDGRPTRGTVEEIETDKSRYAGKAVVLLIRDLRDVAVSYYFHETRRTKRFYPKWEIAKFHGEISEFLHSEVGGIEHFLRFYNIWADNKDVPERVLLMKYEQMRREPKAQLQALLDFLGVEGVAEETVDDAVDFSSFDKMKEMEKEGTFKHPHYMKPGDSADEESFKVRRGKVGGFEDYLSAADIEWLTEKMQGELAPFYGYGEG